MTLDRIWSSAEQLFFKKGYHATSINDITYKAKVAPGTFYIYFTDKVSVYKYLLISYSHAIRMNIAKDVKGVHSRKEAERIGLKSFLTFIKEHPHVYNIIWESLYIDKKLFIEYYTEFAQVYIEHIQRAQAEGQMRDHDPEVVAYLLMGVSNFIGLNWIMFKETTEFDDVVDKVIKALDEGLF